jgi:hypothetical protein
MNFKTFVAPVLTASLLFVPLLELSAKAMSKDNVDNWEYIADADDGTLYFGANRVTVGTTTVLEIKGVNDPDEAPGTEWNERFAFNCETRQIKSEEGWEKVDRETIAEAWLGHACGVGGR